MNCINFDHLLYPVMMSIRQFRDVQTIDQLQILVLECQNKVEQFILILFNYLLDCIINEPNKAMLDFNSERFKIKKDVLTKLESIQKEFSKNDSEIIKQQIKDQIENPEGFDITSSDTESENFEMKMTGQLKIFNPEIQKLQKEIAVLQNQLQHYEKKETRRRSSIEQLTAAHLKEVQQLKSQIRKKSEDDQSNEYIEVVYFDQTTILDPEIQDLLNDKIKNIKQQYDRYVNAFMKKKQQERSSEHSKILLQEEQKIVRSIDTYSIKELIKIILDKEPNQYKIWKLIEEIRSFRFLLTVITNQDQSYGISYKEINETLKCNRNELKKINEIKHQMQETNIQASSLLIIQNQELKNQINSLNQQITNLSMKQSEQVKLYFSNINNNQQNEQLTNLLNQSIDLYIQLQNENQQQLIIIQEQKNQLIILKKQFEFINRNLLILFKSLDFKIKQFTSLDIGDILSDESIILELKKKLNHLDPHQCILYSQYFQLFYNQFNTIKIASNIEIQKKTNSTQTTSDEFKNLLQKSSKPTKINSSNLQTDHHQSPEIKKPKNESKYTQTQFLNFNSNRLIKTENNEIFESKLQINKNELQDLIGTKTTSIFQRLFGDSMNLNNKLKQIRPFIEKMNDKEYQDLINILKNLNYEDCIQNYQTDYQSNQIMKLPQQQPPTLAISNRGVSLQIPSKCVNLKNIIRKPAKSIDYSTLNNQTNKLFLDLDEQRSQAQTNFITNRINSFNKKIFKITSLNQRTSNIFIHKDKETKQFIQKYQRVL